MLVTYVDTSLQPASDGEATPLPPSFALSDLLNEAGDELSTSNDSALLQDDVHYKVLLIVLQCIVASRLAWCGGKSPLLCPLQHGWVLASST